MVLGMILPVMHVTQMRIELRSQLVQFQIQNQSLSKGEGQAKRDNQQLRQDLDVARENLRNAEARMRELERNQQSPPRASPAQLAELDKLTKS